MQEPVVCVICFALVRSAELHGQWHSDTADVVIENTKRIDQLERRLQELEAGYGDQ